MMIDDILEDIKNKLVSKINPKTIILFGSTAKGKADNDSDLDLFIVWDEKTGLSNVKRRIELRKIIGLIDKPLDILTCNSQELKKALEDEKSFTSSIVKEGKIIYGRLE